MSLNAVVYCDCIEKGRLKIPHPRPDLLFIDEMSAPDISSTDPLDMEAHDRWESLRPCQHKNSWLIERGLGNVSLIGSIRSLLKQYSSDPAHEYRVKEQLRRATAVTPCDRSSPSKNGTMKRTGLLPRSLLLIDSRAVHFSG